MAMVNDAVLNEIWEKAASVSGFNPDRWRKDFAGAWIQRDQLGIASTFGWEVCHLVPTSKGGADNVSNLYPIQWENHRMKANRYPVFKTAVTAEGERNIRQEKKWKIQK